MVLIKCPQEDGVYYFENLDRDVCGIVDAYTPVGGDMTIECLVGDIIGDSWTVPEDAEPGDRFHGPIDIVNLVKKHIR